MTGRGLAERDTALRELMDDPACDADQLRRTLERFTVVNRLVSGWGGVYRKLIRPIALQRAAEGRALRILDIGCGGGDVLERLIVLARADGANVDALGIDPDARSLAVAGARPGRRATYRRAHSSELVAELAQGAKRFDVVISNHVLHHLDDAELATVIADSDALADALVVHSDIARSRLAYAAYAVAITPLAPGSFLRTDGLRSIRRSWTTRELAPVLPAGWRALGPAPFRLLAVRGERS